MVVPFVALVPGGLASTPSRAVIEFQRKHAQGKSERGRAEDDGSQSGGPGGSPRDRRRPCSAHVARRRPNLRGPGGGGPVARPVGAAPRVPHTRRERSETHAGFIHAG